MSKEKSDKNKNKNKNKNKTSHKIKDKLEIKGSVGSNYVLSLTIYHENNSLWVVSGDLIYDTIPLKLSEIKKLRPKKSPDEKSKKLLPWSIDCRGIKHFDSCGAAFLLSCLRHAKRNKLKLQLLDLPETLNPLLQVQGIAGLILP